VRLERGIEFPHVGDHFLVCSVFAQTVTLDKSYAELRVDCVETVVDVLDCAGGEVGLEDGC